MAAPTTLTAPDAWRQKGASPPCHRRKKEAAPKGGFHLLLLGLRLEEDHATELEEVEVVEALTCLAAVRSRAGTSQVEADQIHIEFLMLPPGEDVHGGGVDLLDEAD